MESSSSSPSLVAQALQTARYNEIVQLTIHEDNVDKDEGKSSSESEPRVVSLVAVLDQQNGGIQWNPLPDDPQLVLSRHLQTKCWIFPMLNDHHRNRLYEQAIKKAVERLAEQFKRNPTTDTIHALDIGSGTGLLGMIVARQLCETFGTSKYNHLHPKIKITSIEMASSMAQIARQTIHDNGLSDTIHVVKGHSCELPPAMPPAQICVSELLESGLLGEGILPALRDAWERHMQSSDAAAIMIPQRARVYAQLVQSGNHGDWISNYYGPHNDQIASFFDQCCTEPTTPRVPPRFSLDSDGSQLLLDAQAVVVPVHASKLFRDQSLIALSNPMQILDFDFVQRLPPSSSKESRSSVFTATSNGVVQGVLLWWELDLWEDSSLTYFMDPHQQEAHDWQDHWHQCLHILPREHCRHVSPGDSLSIRVSHTDYRIAVGLLDKSALQETTDSTESSSNKRPRLDTMATTALISPERAYELNNTERLSVWTRSIALALKKKGSDALVLDVSDFCWCACLAASLGATKVVSVESGTNAELTMAAARVAQLANGFPRESGSRFDILQCHIEHLTLDALGGTPAQIVMAEYYQVLEGWRFQEALNFYFIVRSLRERQLISGTAKVLPASCRIMACAIESTQLRSAYVACGDTEEGRLLGFDHSSINRLGSNFSEYDLSLPMWQYDYSKLTESVELATLHFQDCSRTDMSSSFTSKTTFTSKGSVDALMIWLEYNFPRDSSTNTLVYSTSGQSSRQLVRMLQQPIVIGENVRDARLVCNFSFSCGPDQTRHALRLETLVET